MGLKRLEKNSKTSLRYFCVLKSQFSFRDDNAALK